MSDVQTQAEQRLALTFALNGITAVVGEDSARISAYLTQPPTVEPYDAWPVWLATRPVTMCVDETDWQVVLALPGADAQTWSTMGDALVAAFKTRLVDYDITRIEPVQILITEGQSMPGVAFAITI